jgi:hypothetical protein
MGEDEMNEKPMNDRPFSHISRHGIEFRCKRCDFREPIEVEIGTEYRPEYHEVYLNRVMVDVSEMIAYHVQNIWKNLNGFSGYDCIEFKFVKFFRED